MFKYRSVKDQLRDVQKKNVRLQQESMQTRADLDFVAIMCDVEIPEEDQEGAELWNTAQSLRRQSSTMKKAFGRSPTSGHLPRHTSSLLVSMKRSPVRNMSK